MTESWMSGDLRGLVRSRKMSRLEVRIKGDRIKG